MTHRPWEIVFIDFLLLVAACVLLGSLVLALFSSLCLGQSVSLEWDANSETDLAGYNIHRSEIQGAGYVPINSALIACGPNDATCTNYTDASIEIGTRYYYVATAVDTEIPPLESGFSNEVSFGLCLGDVNLDGQRNVLDVLQIMNHVVGNLVLTGNNLAVADVNGNGAVNVMDALRIQNHIVGNVALPICP